jgi:hypothetical protein
MSENKTTPPWWRLPLCWARLCGGSVQSSNTHLWFQCATCGRCSASVERRIPAR